MQNGYERRKHKRLPIELQLEVNRVFKQDYEVIDNVDAEISVFNISKTGIGFISSATLPIGYYFNGKIKLGEDSFFYSVIRIVRSETTSSTQTVYGSEFVGLAPFLAKKVDDYERTLEGDLSYYY